MDMIRQKFEKFGQIKAVEMLPHHSVEYQDETAPDISEAYVTFVHSKCAYNAFMAHRKYGQFPLEVVTVVPADSWRQRMNEHIKVPVFLERNFLMQLEETPIQLEKKLLVNVDAYIPLKRWYFITQNLKNDLEYIHLMLSSEPNKSKDNLKRLSITAYEKRLVQLIANNCVADCFQAMTIEVDHPISIELLRCMAPLLKPLISLIIDSPVNGHLIYILPKFCPHLRMLRITGDWGNTFQDESVKIWPSLKILAFNYNDIDFHSLTENGRKFHRFIELNPQLERVLFAASIDIDLLNGIVENLMNIKALSFVRLSFFRYNLLLKHITKRDSLESISIQFNVAYNVEFDKIVVMVNRLGQMRNIKLIALTLNYMPNTTPLESFPIFRRFPITDHYHCACHPDQRFLSFDDILPDLVVPNDNPIIVAVINTNNPIKSQDKSLETDILKLLDSMVKTFPNIVKFHVLKKENRYVYVQVASK